MDAGFYFSQNGHRQVKVKTKKRELEVHEGLEVKAFLHLLLLYHHSLAPLAPIAGQLQRTRHPILVHVLVAGVAFGLPVVPSPLTGLGGVAVGADGGDMHWHTALGGSGGGGGLLDDIAGQVDWARHPVLALVQVPGAKLEEVD